MIAYWFHYSSGKILKKISSYESKTGDFYECKLYCSKVI